MEFKLRPLNGSKVAIVVQCRNLAEACRITADNVIEPLTRDLLLQLADRYDRMAAGTEESLRDDPPILQEEIQPARSYNDRIKRGPEQIPDARA